MSYDTLVSGKKVRRVIEAARFLVNYPYAAAGCIDPSPPEAADRVCLYWNELLDALSDYDKTN